MKPPNQEFSLSDACSSDTQSASTDHDALANTRTLTPNLNESNESNTSNQSNINGHWDDNQGDNLNLCTFCGRQRERSDLCNRCRQKVESRVRLKMEQKI